MEKTKTYASGNGEGLRSLLERQIVYRDGSSFIRETSAGFEVHGSGSCSSGYIGTRATLSAAIAHLECFFREESAAAKAFDI